MSKITNDRLNPVWHVRPFIAVPIWQQWASKRNTLHELLLNYLLTLREQDNPWIVKPKPTHFVGFVLVVAQMDDRSRMCFPQPVYTVTATWSVLVTILRHVLYLFPL